jgi:hypothetical protein
MSRVVQTPSEWSTPVAECTDGCQWDTTGSASVAEDAARDHTAQTGHIVAVKAELRYTFQGATP